MDDIADAGGAMYCFHIEATGEQHVWTTQPSVAQFVVPDNPLPIIEKIHKRNMRAGVAISPDTPSTAITDEIANAVDMLLVMTVYPGII